MPQKHWLWISLHILLILAVLTNLFTGLRLAILSKDWLLPLSPILPQGNMHQAHSIGAISLIITTAISALLLVKKQLFNKKTATDHITLSHTQYKANLFFSLNKIFGYFVVIALIITGSNQYFQYIGTGDMNYHWLMACLLMLYLFSHCIVYYLLYGRAIFNHILASSNKIKSVTLFAFISISAFIVNKFWLLNHFIPLPVKQIDPFTAISINGQADDDSWQFATAINLDTFGGDNFNDGRTNVTIKSVTNDDEIYFLITWQDNTKSLSHLPIIKTNAGWQVQQNGYDKFAEKTYYEDKLALMFSYQCNKFAGDSVHLGEKSLSDKPKHTTGKGYHYKKDGNINDLWQWKAVRTNGMHQADDALITKPYFNEIANRRYTAGYQSDPKESGNYVMNWQWYQQSGLITPKRLPIKEQYDSNSFFGSWFSYQPYQPALDSFALGTVLPAVLYRSNKFEGDRGDVGAYGTYQQNQWTVELVRKLDTSSDHDLVINDGICLWVSAFDHSQIGHTRHLTPIKLVLKNK
jgi:hypothetical protein